LEFIEPIAPETLGIRSSEIRVDDIITPATSGEWSWVGGTGVNEYIILDSIDIWKIWSLSTDTSDSLGNTNIDNWDPMFIG